MRDGAEHDMTYVISHGDKGWHPSLENADDSMCSSMGDDCCACDASIGQYDCEWEEAATCRGGYIPKITHGSDGGRHHHHPCEYSCYHPCTSSEDECWDWLWEMCPAEMDWCMSADATEDRCWSLVERAASTAAAGGDMTEIYAEMAANELASSVRACVEAPRTSSSEEKSTPASGSYVVNNGATNSCQSGNPISTVDECEIAAAALEGFEWRGEASLDYAAKGCFVYDGEATEYHGVYFNTHATGGEMEDHHMVCSAPGHGERSRPQVLSQ